MLSGSLIFFPHGVRVLSVMLGGMWILPGLFVAHLLAAVYHLEVLNYTEVFIRAVLSIMSICLPYYLLNIKEISLKNILMMANYLTDEFHLNPLTLTLGSRNLLMMRERYNSFLESDGLAYHGIITFRLLVED